jgi:hypothetical protein
VICAGAIGASAFQHIGARIGMMLLFLGSAFVSTIIPLSASAMITKKMHEVLFQIFFNLNGLAAIFCFVVLGLTVARSRLRLVVHAYEVKPSWLVIGLLVFTPFVVGMCTVMTAGFAGFVGLIGMALVGMYVDVTPKAKKIQAPYQSTIASIPTSLSAMIPPAQTETVELSVEK